MTSVGDENQRRRKFVDDLIEAVRQAGKADDSDETAAEVARYAVLRVQLARSQARLVKKSENGQKDQQPTRRTSYFTVRSLLGLDVISCWSWITIFTICLLIHAQRNSYFDLVEHAVEAVQQKCLLSVEEVAVEMSRAPVNCEMCRNMHDMPVESNMTRELFLSKYAYTARPVLMKNVISDWQAMNNFSLEFFKQLYDSKPDSYRTQSDAGQFFPYKTEFSSLKEALHMSEERQKKDWYFGWSNADDEIAHRLREFYSRPEFLPADAESSRIDWMFMGTSAKGAQLHIDYVSRPSWQAQIKGRKIWEVVPSPECTSVCHSFNVTVHPGDIINIDTNRWYHATYVYPGDFSVTIGSEYD